MLGTITGLTPGIHINLIGTIIVSTSISFLAKVEPIYLVILITSMAITHTFLDFIPSIFLGCPDTDTELSVLPGHDLLKEGHGYQAVMLANYGSLFAIFLIIILSLPFGILIKHAYNAINNSIPFILIFISTILIFMEDEKLNALKVFFLTGILGWLILNIPETSLNQPLLPLLTGLFGSSTIILSIKNKIKIPTQEIKNPKIKFFRPLLGASIASPLCSFLPGLGSGQAAVIGQTISNPRNKSTDKKEFLVLLGATNTLVMGFSFISLYLISKTRTGAASAINEILNQNLNLKIIILILIVTLLSGIIAFFLTKKIAKTISNKINKLNYTNISIMILIILITITTIVSGFLGLFILVISTLTGIYCISMKVRRTNMMGCLLIPVILFYTL